jgi:hypothetical protein
MKRAEAYRTVDAAMTKSKLDALIDMTLIERRHRARFARELRDVLAGYYEAGDAVDRNRHREAAASIRKLRKSLAATRSLLREVESKLGVMDLASYSPGMSGERLPPGLGDALEKAETVVDALHVDARRPGAPTRWSVDYTIVSLARLLESHEGARPIAFTRDALALVGVSVTKSKIRTVLAAAKREGSISDDE